MADKNNPTLQQAEAIVRRSEAQAKQAALYPNPSVGYEGDQIRGGSYGGGEQGGFVAQTIVLVASSACAAIFMSSRNSLIKSQQRPQLVRVHNDVAQLFYDTLTAQQMVAVRGRLLGLAGDASRNRASVGQCGPGGRTRRAAG